MITRERYGVRTDGSPVIETSTYVEVSPDNPLAEELQGVDGFWARVAVGNSLTVMAAKSVSKKDYDLAKEEHELRVDAAREELQQELDQKQREQEARQATAMADLRKLGIPLESIQALLFQAKTGR